ncbi:MAG: acyl-CoA thioesterase [Deltaproteobacteria bacterium]|nr:acyl-CoA thioesterase [Deltaproteobacteria bacterium]
MHQTAFTVRATQVDTFGHLNNAAYLEIFEWARWEWSAAAGLDLMAYAKERRIGPAIVHIDLSFQREVRMHEPIAVRTWFHEKRGTSRAVVRQQMLREDGEIAAEMTLTFVLFDLDKRRALPLSEEFMTLWSST